MLWPSDDLPGDHGAGTDLNYVGTSPLLSDCSDSAVVSPMRHAFLDCWIHQDPNPLPGLVIDEQSPQGYLSPVSRLPPHDGAVSIAIAFGSFQNLALSELSDAPKVPYILVS